MPTPRSPISPRWGSDVKTPQGSPDVETPKLDSRPAIDNVISRIIDVYKVKLGELANLTEQLSRECNGVGARPLYRTEVKHHTLTTPRTPRSMAILGNKALAPIRSHTEETLELDTFNKCIDKDIDDGTKGLKPVSEPSEDLFDAEDDQECSSLANSMIVSSAMVRPQMQKRLSKLYMAQFKPKDEWDCEAVSDSLQRDLAARSAHTSRLLEAQRTSDTTEGTFNADYSYSTIQTESHVVWRRVVTSPASPSRIVWEVIGIMLILYDTVDIPLVMSFNIDANNFSLCMDWILRLFWSFNISVVLTTGFIENGVLVMSLRSIFIHYCKTWLAVDIITVIPDWLFLILSHLNNQDDGNEDAGSLVRLLRFLRLLRIARLMRMTKLRDAWYMIYDTIDSEKVGIFLEVFKNVLILMLVTHYISCVWFAVGNAQTGDSWLKYHGFSEASWGAQFLASYHWSLTQFASSVDLYPRSSSERVFAIGMVIFGMIGFSYIVGSIASSLARLRALNERRATNFWILRKFLAQKHVPRELCIRIRCYVESQWERLESQISTSNIESLSLLSENLKSDLACAINGPLLAIHPLFSELQSHLHGTMRRLMQSGISQMSLAPLDTMFSAGEDATHMSILTLGTMQYERMHLEASYPEVVESNEDWIAEPVLWTQGWCHLGDLKSTTSSELLQVDPVRLMAIARLNPLAFTMLSAYSRDFTRWLNEIDKEYLSDITQGEIVGTQLEDIVESISTKFGLERPHKSVTASSVSKQSLFRSSWSRASRA